MGWKNFKEFFKIEHNVQVRKNNLLIGSDYISDLTSIDTETGKILTSEESTRFLTKYYPGLLTASETDILNLLQSQDHFEHSIPIFTYDGGEIIEKFCENPEWPNTTHDGELLYENTFSVDKSKIVYKAKRNASLSIESYENRIKELKETLDEFENMLKIKKQNLNKLNNDYPDEKKEL